MGFDKDSFFNSGIFLRTSEDRWVVGVGPFKKYSDIVDSRSEYFFMSDFFLTSETPWWQPRKIYKLSTADFEALIGKRQHSERLDFKWSLPEKTDFIENIASIKDEFDSSELEKIVPVVCEKSEGKISIHEKYSFLKRVLYSPDNLTPYGYWEKGRGMLGLTPETLFKVKGTQLETMALAGTSQEFGVLLEDPKEVKEHEFVKKFLVETLSDWGQLQSTSTYEWSIGALIHLRTDFHLRLNQWNAQCCTQLLQKMHPTPALGVYPESLRDNLKKQPEAHWREEFGAPFGFWSQYYSYFIVAIRSVMWSNNNVRIPSGCGIVKESDPAKEWEELLSKRNSVRDQIGL